MFRKFPDIPTAPNCQCLLKTSTELRSIWDIIWSCAATIFACTFLSIHPNIPAPDESWWKVTRRRTKIMIYAIIAPEMVIWWAMRQWVGARKVARDYEAHGWTKTHGYFVQMGGFMLFENGIPSRTLLLPELEDLMKEGNVDLPDVTEDDIEDKSKGDILSKGLVLLQTSWFIVQCIARGIQGLALTELELVTLAFAVLNGVMYFLWWNKPLDVKCAVPVHLKEDIRSKSRVGNGGIVTINEKAVEEEWESERKKEADEAEKIGGKSKKRDVVRLAITTIKSWTFWIPRVLGSMFASITDCHCDSRFWWPVKLLRYILKGFINLSIAALHPLIDMLGADRSDFIEPGVKRVSTFYASKAADDRDDIMASISAVIAAVFGGIHCIAWSFQFPSYQERILWRVSSLIIVAVPIVFLFTCIMNNVTSTTIEKYWEAIEPVFKYTVLLGVVFYIFARLILLMQAIISLRSLSSGAYETVQWITFVPHI
ncbi:hypothetical protein BDQ12DRAFT_699617 [Crucibulum laeve]|uniref:Uncharacterized protein n=1 Tax=Crucibulum laeve TaxID=68775 RepID=A0A5C3LU51_9AGAR|nr:hypothetical protein BDQ12DRAFT_699617 [Crucibulum laeve]